MKSFSLLLILSFLVFLISGKLFCSNKSDPPQEIEIDLTYSINPVKFGGVDYIAVKVGNKIFLNKSKGKLTVVTSGFYRDKDYCPDDFIIPKKEDFESVISQLGSNAYSVLTDPNGFNMESKTYYATNTKGSSSFNKYFMYLNGNSIQFIDSTPSNINGDLSQKAETRCMLDLSSIKLEFPSEEGDLSLNTETLIKTSSKYLNGHLWKVQGDIFTSPTITYSFTQSGRQIVEFWGNYINGESVYLCDYVYVKKQSVSSSQVDYDDQKVKLIETEFKMSYASKLHFQHSNSPVAPRINGGYYIAFSDEEKFLHVLSYDKNDILVNDFNTTEKAYPHDITETDYGFAIYKLDALNTDHSYLSVYNKNFELINTIQIMNNDRANPIVDSNLEKQIIRYDSKGQPVFGMRYMYRPDNGKLVYSRGRIFLIFAHYNDFLDNGGHTGDTVVTFNDVLQDMDFGSNWGASHSLIQSATFDEYYFWTAALSDAYPEGIKIEYTSKRDFSSTYDPINKKYNLRIYQENDNLAGYIKGYHSGPADGKLGGILYFSKFELYCLIYAKTPNYSEDDNKGKNIIYITTWKFINNAITEEKTKEIKIFEGGDNVMQLRAGKYGDDKIFIIYSGTTSSGGNGYGNVDRGTIPQIYIIKLPDMTYIKQDEKNEKLLMNTNEDLRTFEDGVLIWATSNKEGYLSINKIGTPILDDSYDDIDYYLTKDDLVIYPKEISNNEFKEEEEEPKSSLSAGAKAGIALGVIFGAFVIGLGVITIIRVIKLKKANQAINAQSLFSITIYNNKSNLAK